jgi:hypothetical protein
MAQHGTIYRQRDIIKDADGRPILGPDGTPKTTLRSANWWISYCDANGKRKWESAKSAKKGDAQRLLNLRLGATEKHEIVGPEIGRITVDEALKDVVNDQKMNGRRATKREQGRIDKYSIGSSASAASSSPGSSRKTHASLTARLGRHWRN